MLVNEILNEKQWVADVETKKHPPDGLFAEGSADKIAKWLISSHTDLKSAMSALNFYINRAGKGLSADRKAVLEEVKKILSEKFK